MELAVAEHLPRRRRRRVSTVVSQQELADPPDILILGHYGSGADGPTVMLKLLSPRSVVWLRSAILRVSDAGAIVDLASEREVNIIGVRTFILRRVAEPDGAALRGPSSPVADAEFEWLQDAPGWMRTVGLLEPFLQDKAGHQYLTDQERDAALVVASFGEPDVRIPGSV